MSLAKMRLLVGDMESEIAKLEAAEKSPLFAAMAAAAEAFVDEAERRAKAGERSLNLDFTEAFKGLVIGAAMTRSGADAEALKTAFLLFDKAITVKSRNHWAAYEREADKVKALKTALGVADDAESTPDATPAPVGAAA